MLPYPSYAIDFPKYWLVGDKDKSKYSRSFDELKDTDKKVKKNSDISNLFFHISKQDYFGTLATVLQLMRETLLSKDISNENKKWQIEVLLRNREELLFLQKNYKIVSKKENEKFF